MTRQTLTKGKVIKFPYGSYFGDCPKCGKNDGHLNVHRHHWMVCHQHKVKWFIGGNLFSDLKNENQEIWKRNEKLLWGYQKVEPKIRYPKEPYDPESH